MARIIEHLDTLREKPEHVRHRIALLAAGGVTALVAVTWVTAMASSGVLALKQSEGAEPIANEQLLPEMSDFSNLVGNVSSALEGSNADASLNVIESRESSTIEPGPQNATDKRVIAF